jgi:hypothetical protein
MESNWAWGLALIALTMTIHATGIVFMAVAMLSIRDQVEARSRITLRRLFSIVVGVIGGAGLLLAALHGMEAALWAVTYWWLGALDSLSGAVLYSVDTMSTRGASGLTLENHWRLMGALEATDGMLLFGLSTAFVFSAMQAYWPMVTRHLRH